MITFSETPFFHIIPLILLLLGVVLNLVIDAIIPRLSGRIVQGVSILTLLLALLIVLLQWRDMTSATEPGLFLMDLLSLFSCLLVLGVSLLSILNAESDFSLLKHTLSETCILVLLTTLGLLILATAQNLLVSFLGLEISSLSTGLLIGSRDRFRSPEVAVKYFVLNATFSAIFLLGLAFIYATFRSLDLVVMNSLVFPPNLTGLPQMALGLILVAAFFKLAVIPLLLWISNDAGTSPSWFTGLLSTALPITAITFFLRLLTITHVVQIPRLQQLLLVCGTILLVGGALIALTQEDIKRILACVAAAHVGLILITLGSGLVQATFSQKAIQTTLFFLCGYGILMLGVFAALSGVSHDQGEATQLAHLQGMGKRQPVLCGLFSLFLLGLAGVPVTVGFIMRYRILTLMLKGNHVVWCVVVLFSSLVLAASALKILMLMYWEEETLMTQTLHVSVPASITLTFCAFAAVILGISPLTVWKLAEIVGLPLK